MVKLIHLLIAFVLAFITTIAYGGGAGGSWDDPYTGNGGLSGGGGAGGDWGDGDGGGNQVCTTSYSSETFTANSVSAVCNAYQSWFKVNGNTSANYFTIIGNQCVVGINGQSYWSPRVSCNQCPVGEVYNSATKQCQKKCPERYTLDKDTNQCMLDPQQCLPPYTLIAGVCVAPKKPDPETKTCPMGYTLTGGQCVKDPDKPCDPAIQQCNDDGSAKCDCCEKLDTIIGNQGQQIKLHNRTNELLAESNANQLTANLKLDKINETATKIGDITYKGFDATIKQNGQQTELLKQIEINTRPQSATSSTAPTSAPALTEVTDRQDEQTGLLAQIRDLLKEKKDDPLPDPTDTSQTQPYDPFGALKGFDISQNRINAQGQCPTDKQIAIMGRTFTFKMTWFCEFFAQLSPIILALAYFKGARIILGSND